MCNVMLSNSPVFSPSRVSSPFFCKSSLSSSPDSFALPRSPSSPSSGFKLRLLKLPSGLIRSSSDEGPSTSSSPSPPCSPPAILKRKRPARLDIPIASAGFCGDQATPGTTIDRWREVVEVDGDGYSVYCKKGRREKMEDRYHATVNLQGDDKQAFFGVFDGHGGPKAAEFAANNLGKRILEELGKRTGDEIEEGVRHGYLAADSEFLKRDLRGGTCCVTTLIRDGNLVVSNAGDCRAVISRGGIAEALTSDHRPSREDEKHRIESLGGYVDCYHGVWRVMGTLAVTRGIGDGHLKQWMTAEPETRAVRIVPDHEFLILASDRLWDKVGNQEAVDVARPLCAGIVSKPDPIAACKKLVEFSASRGSVDDISVMIVQLNRFSSL